MASTLPRKLVIMDERGRITVPEYMRERLGMTERCAVFLEMYPNDNPKTLIIKRA